MSDAPNDIRTDAADAADADRIAAARQTIKQQLAKTIVGQSDVLDQLLITLFCGGHCILEGVPGLAKTLMISSLAKTLSLTFSRIQFTPDLMPSDITGTEVIEEDKVSGSRRMRFVKGPLFGHVILADEINRTPPKTQAALLEAMQERQVTVAGVNHKLPTPFFVLATQNPIEQEGTYPLPEAQLDRFLCKVKIDYPTEREEVEIVRLATSAPAAEPTAVLSDREILSLQALVRRVPCADHVMRYATRIVRNSRPVAEDAPQFTRDFIGWGAGPRASLSLVLAAKARAVLMGRNQATIDDIRAVAYPVLRHRLIPNFNAEAEGIDADRLVDMLLHEVPHDATPELSAIGGESAFG